MLPLLTLNDHFAALQVGDYFGAGVEAKQVTLLCKVKSRTKNKTKVEVINGGWGMSFDRDTLTASPFGHTKQLYMVICVRPIPAYLIQGMNRHLSPDMHSVLDWMTKNIPVYAPKRVKQAGRPFSPDMGKTYELDGAQTLRFDENGTSDAEMLRVLLDRVTMRLLTSKDAQATSVFHVLSSALNILEPPQSKLGFNAHLSPPPAS